MPRTAWWLALVAIVLSIAVLFGSRIDLRPSSEPGAAHSSDVGEAAAATPLADPLVTDERAAARTEASHAATRADLDLASTIWIVGRVIVPPDTPVDEHAEVVAYFENDERWTPHRFPIAADGSFRAAFPRDTVRGWLDVGARYLFLRKRVAVALTPPPASITLAPELGGCVRGACIVGAAAQSHRQELVGMKINARGKDVSWFDFADDASERSGEVDDALRFELGGLAPDRVYSITGTPRTFAAIEERGIRVRAGETRTLDVRVELGASIRGRVVEIGGAPVGHAEVRASQWVRRYSSIVYTRAETAEDGSFELSGLVPSDIGIRASKPGRPSIEKPIGAIASGEVRELADLTLAAGATLAGRVRWSEREPAVGAEVRIALTDGSEPQRPALGWWSKRTSTAADGSFRIEGLTTGPFDVSAYVQRADSVDGSSNVGMAEVRSVLPGPAMVLLDLAPCPELGARVVDDLGHGLEQFEVQALPEGLELEGNADEVERASGAPGCDGHFVLRGLRKGAWNLYVESGGSRVRSRIDVGATNPSLVIVVPRAASIAGVVVDASAVPVPGAEVRAKCAIGADDDWLEGSGQATSDAQGRFEIDALPPGPYALRAGSPSLAASQPLALELAPGERKEGVALALRVGGYITGEVRDAGGAPRPDRRVLMVSAEPTQSPITVWSDAHGRFGTARIAPGNYWVRESVGDGLSTPRTSDVVVRDGETTHVVIGGPAAPLVRVRGVVTSNRTALAGIGIVATRELSDEASASSRARTDVDGRYVLELERPGRHDFFLSTPTAAMFDWRSVDVPDVAEFVLDFEVASAIVSGRVFDPDGTPSGSVDVSLVVERPDLVHDGASRGTSAVLFTDADGRFRFVHVAPGTYALRANVGQLWWSGTTPNTAATSVHGVQVSDGESVEVDVTLERAAAIEVEVRDTAGAPVPGADVYAFDAAGSSYVQYTSTSTDASGRAHLFGLPPGDCTLFARTLDRASAIGDAITLRAGETETATLRLVPAAVLTVFATGPDGGQVDATVYARDDQGREFAELVSRRSETRPRTNEQATVVGPLPVGTYALTAMHPEFEPVHRTIVVGGESRQEVRIQFAK